MLIDLKKNHADFVKLSELKVTPNGTQFLRDSKPAQKITYLPMGIKKRCKFKYKGIFRTLTLSYTKTVFLTNEIFFKK